MIAQGLQDIVEQTTIRTPNEKDPEVASKAFDNQEGAQAQDFVFSLRINIPISKKLGFGGPKTIPKWSFANWRRLLGMKICIYTYALTFVNQTDYKST